MRQFINIVESNTIPEFAYHGTSLERWEPDHSSSAELYLASSLETAKSYAREWGDEDETPIVVRFRISDLLNSPHITLEPNAEYVNQMVELDGGNPDDFSWEQTLEEVGTFVAAGFTDADKRLGEYFPV